MAQRSNYRTGVSDLSDACLIVHVYVAACTRASGLYMYVYVAACTRASGLYMHVYVAACTCASGLYLHVYVACILTCVRPVNTRPHVTLYEAAPQT